jgi:hypothetical protein
MANITTYLSDALLAHSVGKTAYTMPTCSIVLYTTNPTLPAGTGGVVATYTGYAAVALSGDWATAAAEGITNSAAITFGACTAGTSTVVGWGIIDGSSNVLWAGTCSLAVSTGVTPQFAASALTLGLT